MTYLLADMTGENWSDLLKYIGIILTALVGIGQLIINSRIKTNDKKTDAVGRKVDEAHASVTDTLDQLKADVKTATQSKTEAKVEKVAEKVAHLEGKLEGQ